MASPPASCSWRSSTVAHVGIWTRRVARLLLRSRSDQRLRGSPTRKSSHLRLPRRRIWARRTRVRESRRSDADLAALQRVPRPRAQLHEPIKGARAAVASNGRNSSMTAKSRSTTGACKIQRCRSSLSLQMALDARRTTRTRITYTLIERRSVANRTSGSASKQKRHDGRRSTRRRRRDTRQPSNAKFGVCRVCMCTKY